MRKVSLIRASQEIDQNKKSREKEMIMDEKEEDQGEGQDQWTGDKKQRPGRRQRKTRSDKGKRQATPRDLASLEWIADQYAARFDQVQMLLSRYPDEKKPFKSGGLIGETTTKDMIKRWVDAGWAGYRRVLAGDRGFVWVTRGGLQLVGLDEKYTAKQPAATRLRHIYAVNVVRFWADMQQGMEWTSERKFRSELVVKKGAKVGAVPDAVMQSAKWGRVAVEVELTPKKPEETFQKVMRLVRNYDYIESEGAYGAKYQRVWFYVPTEKMKALVDEAILALRDDEQKRAGCVVANGLV